MISPLSLRVASLNCLTKAAMLTPCEPSAGPTGGAGVACPAGHWSLILAVTSLAMTSRACACSDRESARRHRGARASLELVSDALHFPVLEFDGRRSTEDRDDDLDRALVRRDFLDRAVEAVEGPRLDLD